MMYAAILASVTVILSASQSVEWDLRVAPAGAIPGTLLANATSTSPNVLLPASRDAPPGTSSELWIWAQQAAVTGGPSEFFYSFPSNCSYAFSTTSSFTVLYLDSDAGVIGSTLIPTINAPSSLVLFRLATVYVPELHSIVSYGGFLLNGTQGDAAAIGLNWTQCVVYHAGQCLVPSYDTHVFNVTTRTWTHLSAAQTGAGSTPTDAYSSCEYPDGRFTFGLSLAYNAGAGEGVVWAVNGFQCAPQWDAPAGAVFPPLLGSVFYLNMTTWTWAAFTPTQTSQPPVAFQSPPSLGAFSVGFGVNSTQIRMKQHGGVSMVPPRASMACFTLDSLNSSNSWYGPPSCDYLANAIVPYYVYDALFATLHDSQGLVLFAGRAAQAEFTVDSSLSQATWLLDTQTDSFKTIPMDASRAHAISASHGLNIDAGTLASANLIAFGDDGITHIAWGGVVGNAGNVMGMYQPWQSCAHRYGGEDALASEFLALPQLIHVLRIRPAASTAVTATLSQSTLALVLLLAASEIVLGLLGALAAILSAWRACAWCSTNEHERNASARRLCSKPLAGAAACLASAAQLGTYTLTLLVWSAQASHRTSSEPDGVAVGLTIWLVVSVALQLLALLHYVHHNHIRPCSVATDDRGRVLAVARIALLLAVCPLGADLAQRLALCGEPRHIGAHESITVVRPQPAVVLRRHDTIVQAEDAAAVRPQLRTTAWNVAGVFTAASVAVVSAVALTLRGGSLPLATAGTGRPAAVIIVAGVDALSLPVLCSLNILFAVCAALVYVLRWVHACAKSRANYLLSKHHGIGVRSDLRAVLLSNQVQLEGGDAVVVTAAPPQSENEREVDDGAEVADGVDVNAAAIEAELQLEAIERAAAHARRLPPAGGVGRMLKRARLARVAPCPPVEQTAGHRVAIETFG